MKRFILVSFAFLALVFYELSGGADFQPRVAVAEPVAEVETVKATASLKATPVKATTLVASPAITPVRPVPARPEAAPVEADIDSVAKLDQIRNSLSQGLSLFPESDPIAQPLMLASLEQGVAGLSVAPPVEDTVETVAAEPAPPPADIREITGTRVNMRDGPGTIYPVISRLTLGHKVEVLGDSGTGWLRLRTKIGRASCRERV